MSLIKLFFGSFTAEEYDTQNGTEHDDARNDHDDVEHNNLLFF